MTDLDGRNILSNSGKINDMKLFIQWGRLARQQHQFMFSTYFRVSEFEEGMTCRSNCTVSKLRAEVFANAFTTPITLALRKNGDNVNSISAANIRNFDYGSGEVGVKEAAGEEFSFLKDDLMCFMFFEAQALAIIDYQISCVVEFDVI